MENERKRLSGMEFPGLEGKTYYTTGFPTEEGGEVFNYYDGQDANKAVSIQSHAEGWSTHAGGKGFKIITITDLHNGTGEYELSSTDGLEIGM